MTSSIFNSKRAGLSLAAGLVLFVATFCLAHRTLEILYFRPNFQSMAVATLGDATEVLVLGSSRVFFGVDPSRFDGKLTNLAADYLDLSTAEELWRLHEGRVPLLRTLVLEFGLATLRYDTRTLEPYACYHLGLSGIPPWPMFLESFDAAVHRTLSVFFKWRLTPLFWSLDRSMANSTLEPLAAQPGFVPTEVSFSGDERVAGRRQQKTIDQLASQDPAVFARNLEAAKRLIADANRRGVNVKLLRFPKSPAGRKLYLAAWDDVVDGAVKSLTSDVRSLRFEMIDMSRDERFLTEDFRDPDHLNRHGAARLSALLAPRL